MSLTMDDLNFAADFPQATREQWLTLVEGVLKGADFNKKLLARTQDGIAIQPLYPKAENAPRTARAEAGPWRIAQRLDHPDPKAANALALLDLEGGADALTLVSRQAPSARGFGLAIDGIDDLEQAFSGIMLDLVHLRLDAGGHGRNLARMVADFAERRGHALSDLSLDLGMDPIGAMAATGRLSAPWPEVARRMGETLADLTGRGFKDKAFLVDGRPYHEAGGSEAQELAATLATGLAYLRALEAHGHSLDAARNTLSFLLVADADEFLTVAKLRALRRLWARVEEACGLEPRPIRLHAETAWRMTTRRDPWVNMLRGTVAAFSAGIGGADAITVLPFTAALGLPDAFARRVARNAQAVLLEEANLWRVADPAAGAGGFEALTDALCEKAWAQFQEIEREGGITANLRSGALQARIAGTREQRQKAVATRREPITGTSEFPNIHEAPVQVLRPLPDREEDTEDLQIAPLPSMRRAEPFERLRDLSDAHLARTGERPKVFLANLGPVAAFTARATFAKNFFEAGGIETISNDGFASPHALTNAFAVSGTEIACLCSSDDVYFASAEEAILPNETAIEEAARILKRGGASYILMAGRPIVREQALRSTGISEFIYSGCDLFTVLSEMHAALGPQHEANLLAGGLA